MVNAVDENPPGLKDIPVPADPANTLPPASPNGLAGKALLGGPLNENAAPDAAVVASVADEGAEVACNPVNPRKPAVVEADKDEEDAAGAPNPVKPEKPVD